MYNIACPTCNGRVADNNRQVPPRERVQIIISSNFQPSGQNNNPELASYARSKENKKKMKLLQRVFGSATCTETGTGTAAASSNNIMVD